jgi:pimeloyl-ACP methyl ester carboxylesterase
MQRLLQAEDLTVIENAGHFLQEDQGEHIGTFVAGWLAEQ